MCQPQAGVHVPAWTSPLLLVSVARGTQARVGSQDGLPWTAAGNSHLSPAAALPQGLQEAISISKGNLAQTKHSATVLTNSGHSWLNAPCL